MKIIIVYGTRPEAIKMAPLILALDSPVVVNTGQHKDLTKEIREFFGFKDDYDLELMRPDQTLQDITVNCLEKFTAVLKKEKPDIVLVHGDTTTAMSCALAAFYEKVQVGHIEAGLRTFDKDEPFPEEVNRTIIDTITDYAFCPTIQNKKNIAHNKKARIFVVGNTIIDALKIGEKKIENKSPCKDPYIFVTAHRRENHGKPLEEICSALEELSSEINIIYAAHPNPKVQAAVKRLRNKDNIQIIEPLNYKLAIQYMKYAKLILSDSGGIQEEAPGLNVPVLCLREKTERQEIVKAGAVKLVGHNKEKIINTVRELLYSQDKYKAMTNIENPYGDGTTASQIISHLQKVRG